MWSRFLAQSSAVPSPLNLSVMPGSILLDVIFWVAAAACVIAQWFILRAVWRVIPSVTGSPNVPMPRRASEVVWAIIPAVLLAGAFAGAWRTMHPASSPDIHPPTSHRAPLAPVARS